MAFRTNKVPVLQEKSASGAVATFNTALAMPLASCSIAVNAWQEGSGDPYPAGGSAQQWDEEWELGIIDIQTGNKVSSTTRIRTKNFIPVLPNTTYYKVSPTTGFRWVALYNSSKQYLGYLNTSGTGSFTTPNDAYYIKSYTESNSYGTTYQNDISINYPETDTAYHPYSNVRPIHGFSEVNATRAGKNLFNYESVTWEDGYLDDNQEYQASTVTHYSSPFPITPNTTITASGFSTGYTSNIYMLDKNRNWLGRLTSRYTTEHHFTTPQNCYYLQIQCQQQENGSNLQFEAGNTPTAYEPYVTPTIYTIQLGQEVYGADVDVVNGVAHCTHGYIDFNNTQFSVYSSDSTSIYYCSNDGNVVGYNGDNICSCFKKSSVNNIGNMDNLSFIVRAGSIYFRNTDYVADLEGFIDSVRNNGIVVELAEPFDIQLTPQQIETLIGNNTIFADTGDVDLTYKDLDIAKRGSFREVFKLPS